MFEPFILQYVNFRPYLGIWNGEKRPSCPFFQSAVGLQLHCFVCSNGVMCEVQPDICEVQVFSKVRASQ